MSDSLLLELMEDAKRVAVYGRRSGRLRDATLYDAIQKAEPITALDWTSNAVVALQQAVSEATQAIHPVTLIDLKGGWDPFGAPGKAAGSAASKAVRYIFVACAAILIFFCAYYTTWQKEATALIDEVVALREEQQTVLMNEIFVHLMDAATETKTPSQNSGGLTRIAMREKIEQARHFDTKIGNQKAHINDIRAKIWPRLPAYEALASSTSGVLESLALTTASIASPVGVVAGIGQAPIDPAALSLDESYGQYGSSTEACGGRPVVFIDRQDETSDADLARLRSLPENARNRIIVVGDDSENVVGAVQTIIRIQSQFATISCTIGLNNFTDWNSFAIDPAFKTIKAASDLLGLWVLPALYGALGAIMFYMRSFLSPLFPNPAPERVLLRVAIGAFAGVAIAWFWSPAIGEMGGQEVTFSMLTLAFILGFSIDVFFALLDRLVATLTSSVGRIGTTS